MSFNHYGLENGISQESVRTILKDRDGFIWLGTQDGLNRFDGYSFKIYKNDLNNKSSIVGNYINCLMEDKGKIWIGTANNGLCYYDKSSDYFVGIGKSDNNCIGLEKDKQGNIFALFASGDISVFLPQKNDLYIEDNSLLSSFHTKDISTIYISDDDVLFIGSNDGKLQFGSIINNKKNIITDFSNQIQSINKLLKHDNLLWLGTDQGLYVYNLLDLSLKEIKIDKTSNAHHQIINDISIHSENYYIASDIGLYICSTFDKVQLSFNLIKKYIGDENNKNSITSNRVYDLLYDNHLLWVGTNKLDVVSLKPPVFKTINNYSNTKLNNDFIFSIFKSKDYLFIGTRNGLNCIDSFGNNTIITVESTNNKLASNVIRGITLATDNQLWLATTKGISIMDLNNFVPSHPDITTIVHDPDNPNSLSNNNTRSIYIDHKNRIWSASFGGGLNLFIGNIAQKDYSFFHYKHQSGKNSLGSDFTYNISQDKSHNYWVATKNGLNKLHLINDEYSRPEFTIFNKKNKALSSKTILSTYQDIENECIWIGSHSGMYMFDIKTEKVKGFNNKNGLTSTVVYNILEDDNNMLWLSTNDGIFRFDKSDETFVNFNIQNGLQSSEFNLGAVYNDNNILYFGGVKGVNYFSPKDIGELYFEGDLVFTSLKVKDIEIRPDNNHKIINKNIIKSDLITLNYDDFPAYLSFSDLNYDKEKMSKFVYRLLPNDKKWNQWGDRKEIQLLNLQHGDYRLQVQGITNNKYWSKPPLELKISVIAAWYKSNLAYLIYSLAFIGVVSLFYRYQLEKKLKQEEHKRSEELTKKNKIIKTSLAEKEVLFKEIHHRVKNNLQVVASIMALQERFLKDPKAKEAIKESQNRIHSISLIHQKLYTDESIVAIRMRDYIEDLVYSIIGSMQITTDRLKYTSDIEDVYLDLDTATPIGLILNELIINSFKHNFDLDVLQVKISLLKKNKQLYLMVRDNGKGISKDFEIEKAQTFGMKMIYSLLKKLRATISFNNDNGLEVRIEVKKYKEIAKYTDLEE